MRILVLLLEVCFLPIILCEHVVLRPNLYFGFREKQPDGLLFGMGWFKTSSYQDIKYECFEKDGFKRWGFIKADMDYGKQFLYDGNLQLTTEHIFDSDGSVLLRVNGTSLSLVEDENSFISILFFLHSAAKVFIQGHSPDRTAKGLRGDDCEVRTGDGKQLKVHWGELEVPHEHDTCTEHTVRFRPGKPSPELSHTHYVTWQNENEYQYSVWGVVDSLKGILSKSEQAAKQIARKLFHIHESNEHRLHDMAAPLLSNKIKDDSTSAALQRVLRVPFSIIVKLDVPKKTKILEEFEEVISHAGKRFDHKEQEFDDKFNVKFHLGKAMNNEKIVARAALSNSIGSIGYFFGSNILDDGSVTKPGSLLTQVPSRSFFPRGFFWDEGFHQILVSKFNPHLSKQIILSWLNRFEENGWVAREQILGIEAISRVPQQFLKQNRTFANPPTLLLAVESIFEQENRNESNEKMDFNFYSKVLDTFLKHRNWIRSTQKSNVADGLMAWKGRSADGVHTLTSGIDDYPRGVSGQDFKKEAHVDLLSWVAWEDLRLASLARKLYREKEASVLEDSARSSISLILQYHWNPNQKFFNDIGHLGDNRYGLVPHIGYVGLMPFLLKLIPVKDMNKLWGILTQLLSQSTLRASKIGIRSLSKADPYFEKDENYWRGAIWINMNYLCVEALKYYSEITVNLDSSFSKLALQLANDLKSDVVKNVVKRYEDEGFLFENYDSTTGIGRGTRPFTGWTALVALLMEE